MKLYNRLLKICTTKQSKNAQYIIKINQKTPKHLTKGEKNAKILLEYE